MDGNAGHYMPEERLGLWLTAVFKTFTVQNRFK